MPVSPVKMYFHFQKLDRENSQIEGKQKESSYLERHSWKTTHRKRKETKERKEGQESNSKEKNGLGK
jgi:hypothetical protein